MRAFARLRTSLIKFVKCSLKSKTGLICTPNIVYALSGGRYVMRDPSKKDIGFICSWRNVWFLRVSRLPRAQSAPVASHFVVSS